MTAGTDFGIAVAGYRAQTAGFFELVFEYAPRTPFGTKAS
jgi:hypothetical protein